MRLFATSNIIGFGRSEFVVDDLLGVEVVDALILSGVAAVGKAFTEVVLKLSFMLSPSSAGENTDGSVEMCR